MKDEFIYELSTGFEYHSKGDVIDAKFITLKAPSSKNITLIAPIRQFLTTAIEYAQKNYSGGDDSPSDSGDAEIGGDTIISMIEASGVDIEKFVLHFQHLFTKSGLFLVDGEVKMTVPIMESFSIDDFYGLAGEFIKNFILPSLMNQKNN